MTSLKNNIRHNNSYRDENKLSEDVDTEGVAIKRLPPVQSTKYIKLTDSFYDRPLIDQCNFLWSLSSSMNNSNDVMQKERNEVLRICEKQEKQIIELSRQNNDLSRAITDSVNKMNVAAQLRATELYETKQEHVKAIKALRKEIEKLKD